MEELIQKAIECGFTSAAPMEPQKLKTMTMVRNMCAENRCHAYNHNWTCPPNCGTLEECEEEMHRYQNGILLQTTGNQKRRIDTRAYRATEERHTRALHDFADYIHIAYPEALCLGAGGCRICKTCAFPKPCRFPDKAYSSMEAYGLFVTQVCRDNNVRYYYGDMTITYTACVLF